MKFFAEISALNQIKPCFDSDYQALKRIPKNTEVEIEIKQKRNIRFHRKAMALLNLAFQNQDKFEQFNHLRYYLTMKAGWVDIVATPQGQMFIPKSISFSAMDEIEFSDWYDKVLDQVINLIGSGKEEIEQELINFF